MIHVRSSRSSGFSYCFVVGGGGGDGCCDVVKHAVRRNHYFVVTGCHFALPCSLLSLLTISPSPSLSLSIFPTYFLHFFTHES